MITIGCTFLKNYFEIFIIADIKQSIKLVLSISNVSHMDVFSSVNYIEITNKLLVRKLF